MALMRAENWTSLMHTCSTLLVLCFMLKGGGTDLFIRKKKFLSTNSWQISLLKSVLFLYFFTCMFLVRKKTGSFPLRCR